jgi:hypothetical protein
MILADLRQGSEERSLAAVKRGHKHNPEEWVWMFQGHLRVLATDRRMTGSHWRVLAYLMSCATFAQDITIKQKDIAGAMGLAFQTISRVLADLVTIGIIARVDTHAYPPTYRFNSRYIYKGRLERLTQRRAYQGKEGSRG